MSSSKERKEVRMGETCQVPLAEVEYCYIGDAERDTYTHDRDVKVWNGGVGLDDKDVVDYLIYAAHTFRIAGDKVCFYC